MHHIIILAGGKGSRMHATSPKVLHQIAGTPMLRHVLRAVSPLCVKPTIIVGYGGAEVEAVVGADGECVWQYEQLGTGHAVACAKDSLSGREDVESIVVLPGDHPLVSAQTIRRLVALHHEEGNTLSLATVRVPHFSGDFASFMNCGRIIRDAAGSVAAIVEYKDATPEQREITEVNVSFYCFDARWLWESVGRLQNVNAAKEYYLTDLVSLAVQEKRAVGSFIVDDPIEGMGVNTPEQAAVVEKYADRLRVQ